MPSPIHNRPTRIYPPGAFKDKAVLTAIFYTVDNNAGENTLIYQTDYSAVRYSDNGKAGLILGIVKDETGFKRTDAASGVPVKRHTLISISQENPAIEVIYSANNPKVEKIECLAVIEGLFLNWLPNSSHIRPGECFLLIENGTRFFKKSYRFKKDMPTERDLANQSPESVYILDRKANIVYQFEPADLKNFSPIAFLKMGSNH